MNITNNIQIAVSALRKQQVIIYPTEAVWGMGCDPQSELAVNHLLCVKKRPIEKGLILIASEFSQLVQYVNMDNVPENLRQQMFDSWPGANTWLLPCSKTAPHWITGGSELIAVRVTNHATVVSLCNAFSGAIVSTSANLTGKPTSTNLKELTSQFADTISVYLDESLGGNAQPSTIRHGLSGKVIRN